MNIRRKNQYINMLKMSIQSILRGALYERIFSAISVVSIIGYSTYVITKNEEKKNILLNNLLNRAHNDYDQLYLCNLDHYHKIVKPDYHKPLVLPERIKNVSECNDLYDIYKKSYESYYKNKYNIMNKYLI